MEGNSIERGSSPESEPKIRNLLTLSEGEREILKKRIEQHEGLVRVFIHPFFAVWSTSSQWDEVTEEEAQRLEDVRSGISRVLESGSPQKPPIIILEQEGDLPRLSKYYASLVDAPYIVPTYSQNPTPKFDETPAPGQELTKEEEEAFKAKNWALLIEKLNGLGIKKVLIGGTKLVVQTVKKFEGGYRHNPGYLRERKDALDTSHADYRAGRKNKGINAFEYYVFGCVGGAISGLSKGFQVEISNLAFPEPGARARRIEKSSNPLP